MTPNRVKSCSVSSVFYTSLAHSFLHLKWTSCCCCFLYAEDNQGYRKKRADLISTLFFVSRTYPAYPSLPRAKCVGQRRADAEAQTPRCRLSRRRPHRQHYQHYRHDVQQHTTANMPATAAKPLPPAYLSHIGVYFASLHDLFTTTGGCVGLYVEGA